MQEMEKFDMEPGATIANGAQVIAQVVDSGALVGVKFPPATLKVMGKQARELLAADFPPEMVVAAGWIACLRGRPELTSRVAGDLQLASAGVRMTEVEYQTKLKLYEAQAKGPSLLDQHREEQAERNRKREEGRAA